MTTPPAQPKIYHITHVNNLPDIVADGGLFADATMTSRGGPRAGIGMSSIKTRRLTLPVHCHAGDFVGDYVPFYFCPRSIMLFVIHRGNHPHLTYGGGQGSIVTLEASLDKVLAWATTSGRRWVFSFCNASAGYAEFSAEPGDLHDLDWTAIAATDFRLPAVKEAKQAEFLVHGWFPWTLVDLIGVHSPAVQTQAAAAIATASHQPRVVVREAWYY